MSNTDTFKYSNPVVHFLPHHQKKEEGKIEKKKEERNQQHTSIYIDQPKCLNPILAHRTEKMYQNIYLLCHDWMDLQSSCFGGYFRCTLSSTVLECMMNLTTFCWLKECKVCVIIHRHASDDNIPF